MKVLVVDDSILLRNKTAEMLTANNYEVYVADNGAEALDKYAKFKPHIVTLDITMPLMDGYETLTRLLKLDANAKVIITTASESEVIIEKCLHKGAVAFLSKPYEEEELLSTIKNVSSGGRQTDLHTLLYMIANTVDKCAKKILAPQVTVVVKDIEIIRQENSQQMQKPSNFSKITSVPGPVQEFELKTPDNTLGYISKFHGQQNGVIISFIETMIATKIWPNSNEAKEFFDVINQKICYFLAGKGAVLDPEPIRLYDDVNDKSSLGNQIAKATITIKFMGKNMPFEIYLPFSLMKMFETSSKVVEDIERI